MAGDNKKITVEIEDRRAEGEEAEIKAGTHFARLLSEKCLSLDALGGEEVPLRRIDDDNDRMVANVRNAYARMANFTVAENPDKAVGGSVATAAKESLTEPGAQKISTLFRSLDAGYEGYALQSLRSAFIKPGNLPEGSVPLWESPQAALDELLAKLTPEMLEVIERDYTTPAIVIEPVMYHESVFVKDHRSTDSERTYVGHTVFYVSEPVRSNLYKADEINGVNSTDGERIVGWRIGIADKAKVTKKLKTDGDVANKTFEDRVRDFHGKSGHGKLGFTSVLDSPTLYGLMINQSRCVGLPPNNTIDYVQEGVPGARTIGTYIYNNGQYPCVVGGGFHPESHIHPAWGVRIVHLDASAYLRGFDSSYPGPHARVRLALMFNKS